MNKSDQKRRIRKYAKVNLKITRELRDIIHGYVMSDGYIRDDGTLTVDQSTKQAKFAEWLGEKFKSLRTPTSEVSEVNRTHSQTDEELASSSKRFNTRALLQGFHAIWYKPFQNNVGETRFKKKLPINIRCFFSPLFITLWFAGDGGRTADSRGAKFEVTCFSPEERIILKQLFWQKYEINASLNRAGVSRAGTVQWTLNILSGDYDKFRSIVTQYDLIETIFPYKLWKK
jgi:LAGLIDADG DNA endonuclease family